MSKSLSKQEISKCIKNGISSKIWANYDTVKVSLTNGFPIIGVGCWYGDRADNILNDINDGHKYMDTSYKELHKSDKLNELICLLETNESYLVQDKHLSEDADHCVKRITHHDHLVDPKCIVYAGIWCVPDVESVISFIKTIPEDIDKNNLESLHQYFIENFHVDSHVSYTREEIESLGGEIYNYVASL